MRAVIIILIIAIVALIGALASGFLSIDQVRGGRAPQVDASGKGVSATGGQAPAFEVQTGSVKVGSKEGTVKVPTLVVEKPSRNEAAAIANNAM
jgi:hypothetical protein